MPKNHKFMAGEALTSKIMNDNLVQDSQILQTTGISSTDVMSQKAVSDAIAKVTAEATLVIGLASSGYTDNQVDILIKTTDNVKTKIHEAIAKLPSIGGEIKFLHGTYNVDSIEITKNILISGMGKSCKFQGANIFVINNGCWFEIKDCVIIARTLSSSILCYSGKFEVVVNNVDFILEDSSSYSIRSVDENSGFKVKVNNCTNVIIVGKTASNWSNIWVDGVTSSPDGNITKWSDGKMEQRIYTSGIANVTIPWGVVFESPSIRFDNFVIPFVSTPTVILSPRHYFYTEGCIEPTAVYPGHTHIVRPNSYLEFPYSLDILAVGRWK